MAGSSDVVANNQILATDYNKLRADVLDNATGHDHEATDGKRLDKNALRWTNAKLLLGAGAAEPTEIDKPAAPTKEFFVPVTYGTEMTYYLQYPVARCNGANEWGYTAFRVPHDFSTITTAEIVVICRATQAAANWDIYSGYAAAGQGHSTHQGNDTTTTYNVSTDEIEVVNIAGILGALAANDYVGVSLKQATAGHNVDILGVHFKYS